MPPIENVMVIRHGESEDDINPELKSLIGNAEVGLTEQGILQVEKIAEQIEADCRDFEKITLYVSPFKRAKETGEIILRKLNDRRISLVVEPSLRALDMGNISNANQKEIEKERYEIGALKYKFKEGDDSSVYVSNIYDFVRRVITDKHINSTDKECLLIITHGFPFRVVVKAFTTMTDEDFRWIKNPPNSTVCRIFFDPKTNHFMTQEDLPKLKS